MESLRFYVMEHMEEFLFDWSRCEYLQCLKYLQKQANTILVFSNCDTFLQYKGDFAQKNQDNIKEL